MCQLRGPFERWWGKPGKEWEKERDLESEWRRLLLTFEAAAYAQ